MFMRSSSYHFWLRVHILKCNKPVSPHKWV